MVIQKEEFLKKEVMILGKEKFAARSRSTTEAGNSQQDIHLQNK